MATTPPDAPSAPALATTVIKMRYDDDKPAGEVLRLEIPRGERIKKGFRAGGPFFVCALCSLPIPLMHFILVPLFLALGGVRAWSFWTSDALLEKGSTSCPRCQNPVVISNTPDQWPVKIQCEKCGYPIRLYTEEA